MICVQVLQHFETSIPLGNYSEGEYTVYVNGEKSPNSAYKRVGNGLCSPRNGRRALLLPLDFHSLGDNDKHQQVNQNAGNAAGNQGN